ncbi:MAG: hypothetical protein DI637_10680 [Citromicrobium sp.]|nr:MAG: hypothetical protein DI637_10680 [Citromicrobium sp.]
MWAHYANNHSGFVLEFDAEAVQSSFEDSTIRAIDYRDEPDERILGSLQRAAVTKKPRHAIWLRQGVMSAAYFSKHLCWGYEQEMRLVVSIDDVEDVDGNMILPMPINCVTSLIAGKNSPENFADQSRDLAENCGIDWYEEIIGKSHPKPFFKNTHAEVFEFDGSNILRASNSCARCREPIGEELELCSW